MRIALNFIELVHMCMPNGLGAAVCGCSGHLTRYQSVPTIGICPSKFDRLSVREVDESSHVSSDATPRSAAAARWQIFYVHRASLLYTMTPEGYT